MPTSIMINILSGWAGVVISCLVLKNVFFKEKTWIDTLVIMMVSLFVMLILSLCLPQLLTLHWMLYSILGGYYPVMMKSFFEH